MANRFVPARRDTRVIIHFDYDCFYAAVFEARNPALKSLPFAVQQKQIIVTANYVARRQGLHKLQLVKDARRICPDVIIELGEDISQFRDASKELYTFIKSFSWNNKVERLGFDEVWLDVTDMVEYNLDILNKNALQNSFFQLSKEDPTTGFVFDATAIAGHPFPKDYVPDCTRDADDLTLRMRLGSHLALFIRHQLEQQKGYTATVGISTTKLLSKLVGNLNKPKGQTTIMPPLSSTGSQPSNVTAFLDDHEVGKIPGIGFKLALKLREFVLERPSAFDNGLLYGANRDKVTVRAVRSHPEVDAQMLEKVLAGPGSVHGIGFKVWCLLHGIDDTEVSSARAVPTQISIEDSYIRLDTMPELLRELTHLARSLLTRMRIDLMGIDDDHDPQSDHVLELEASSNAAPVIMAGRKWLARPKVLRLTTRPRLPLRPDGTRERSFKRISHSGPLPNFVFSLSDSVDSMAEKLVNETLLGMFRKLHPEKAGWNLSLVNLAVTNMAETAGDTKTASGRDISTMFKKQDDVLKEFRVEDVNLPPSQPNTSVPEEKPFSAVETHDSANKGIEEAANTMFDSEEDAAWDDGEDDHELDECCIDCGLRIPGFAMGAHRRYHLQDVD